MNIVAFELWGVLLIKDSEGKAVESRQTLFSRKPEKSIARLDQRVDTILRKTIFSLPRFMAKACDVLPGIKGRDNQVEKQQTHDEKQKPSRSVFTL